MAQQDLTFVSTARPKDWVTKDRAHTFTFRAYSAGTQQVPSAATISIVKPGGVALATPVSGATVTIAGGGDMTYALTAGNADELGEDWTAKVTYTVSTVVYDGAVTFDVVMQAVHNVVIHADLALHHVDIASAFTGSETSTANYIRTAYEDVCSFLDGRGNRPYLVLNSQALRRPIEHRALQLFFGDKVRAAGDQWALLRDEHGVQYQTEIQALGSRLVYDLDESGDADSSERGGRDTGMRIRF